MKDSKSILLLVVSVLLILVSFALLWTWGYQFNDLTKAKSGTVFVIKDSTAAANATRDSLKRVYTATINSVGTLDSTWLTADSLKGNLDIKLSEFYKLRNEIAILLKNPGSKADIDNAKTKIGELQKKVEQLRDRNVEVERENARLKSVLEQLSAGNTKDAVQNLRTAVFDNKPSPEKNTPVAVFAASDLKLSAMMVEDDKEQETYQAIQTDKMIGTFTVRNNNAAFNNAEIVIVVLQPNGRVLQNSGWESGSFETREGKKIYSSKLRFEYNKGEAKHLSFSLSTNNFEKGNYTMQIYQNGLMIGKMSKTLI